MDKDEWRKTNGERQMEKDKLYHIYVIYETFSVWFMKHVLFDL